MDTPQPRRNSNEIPVVSVQDTIFSVLAESVPIFSLHDKLSIGSPSSRETFEKAIDGATGTIRKPRRRSPHPISDSPSVPLRTPHVRRQHQCFPDFNPKSSASLCRESGHFGGDSSRMTPGSHATGAIFRCHDEIWMFELVSLWLFWIIYLHFQMTCSSWVFDNPSNG